MPPADLRSLPETFEFEPPPLDRRAVHRLMLEARCLEERLIKMSMSQDGHFWIGGPGEEAFNVPLGLLVDRGHGLAHDYLHLHYRSSAIGLAMGIEMIDFIRQMASRATDPFTGGRNFVNHLARREWNIVPVASTIETQYSVAPGTALAQLRHGGRGITIVNGGDAGSAEGDFATCLNWANRPGHALPILMIVANNRYGISTPFEEVAGDRIIAQRAEAFGIRWDVIDGNDPDEVWPKLARIMEYVRTERRPFCLEVSVSRLHGHSSSSGAGRVHDEVDCLDLVEERLISDGELTREECAGIRADFTQRAQELLRRVREEPHPDPSSIHDHTFA